jgi:hypothetical protein
MDASSTDHCAPPAHHGRMFLHALAQTGRQVGLGEQLLAKRDGLVNLAHLRESRLFAVLPQELQDTAFLDRLHAYFPGWEHPTINPANFATGNGFMSGYLAEILVELRRRNFRRDKGTRTVF